jgi:single-strand DNA-binding protein
MASFNQVILLGNLTRDPVLKYIPSTNTPVVDFGIACNRKFKTANGEEREDVVFVDCSAFGRQAEVINEYCRKGRPLFIQGRLKLDQWEDKQGGGKRSRLTVVVENFQLLGSRDGGGGGGGAPQQYDSGSGDYQQRAPHQQNARPAPQQAPQQPFSEEQQFSDNDIPF